MKVTDKRPRGARVVLEKAESLLTGYWVWGPLRDRSGVRRYTYANKCGKINLFVIL